MKKIILVFIFLLGTILFAEYRKVYLPGYHINHPCLDYEVNFENAQKELPMCVQVKRLFIKMERLFFLRN